MPVTGLGIDLTAIARFDGMEERLWRYFLSEEEARELADVSTPLRAQFLAVRWACKEAIFKATGRRDYTALTLLHDPDGKPYIKGHPELLVSVSHDNGFVVVIIQRNEDLTHERDGCEGEN